MGAIGNKPSRASSAAAVRPGPAGTGACACSLRLWGGCTLTTPGGRVIAAEGADALILARAALDAKLTRTTMAAALWPESRSAGGNLRTRLHRLQHRAGMPLFQEGSGLSLLPQVRISCPLADELVTAAAPMDARGWELLGTLDFSEFPESADWVAAARERWRQKLLNGLRNELARVSHDPGRCTELLTFAIALEPLGEHWYRELMQAHVSQGNRASALLAYERCKAALATQLGVRPDVVTQQLHSELLRHQPPAPLVYAPRVVAAVDDGSAWPLLERRATLAQITRALDAGLHVVVEGEAGIGKTALLKQLTGNLPICYVRAQPSDARCAYASLASLLRTVNATVDPQLGQRHRLELARIAPSAEPDAGPEAPATPFAAVRLRAALQEWLRAAGRAGLRVVAIDDLHFADPSSLVCLAWLLEADSGNEDEATPRLVLSARSVAASQTLQATVDAFRAQGRLHLQVLDRLSHTAVLELVERLRPEWPDLPCKAHAIHTITGGNPLHARQLIESGRWDAQDLAGTLRAQVEQKLAAISEETRCFAYVAALMDGMVSLDLASDVLGQHPARLASASLQLEALGILSGGEYSHDLIREAVQQAIPSTMKRCLHARLAQALESAGAPPQSSLRHWMLSHETARALPHALRYARWLTSVGQREAAFDVIEAVVLNPRLQAHADELWCIAEFLPIARIGQLVSASALKPLTRLCDQLRAREAELTTPLARAFSLHVQACIASELDGLVERAYELSLQALRLVGDHALAQAELFYALASHAAYLGLPVADLHRSQLTATAERLTDPARRERCEQYRELVDLQRRSFAGTLDYWRRRRARARRQGHAHAVRAYEYHMAHQCYAACAFGSTIRLLRNVVSDMEPEGPLAGSDWKPYFYLVPAALQSGRFDLAAAWMPAFERESQLRSYLWKAWTHLILGDIEAFRSVWSEIRLEGRSPRLTLMYIVRGLIIQLYGRMTGLNDLAGIEDSIDFVNELRDPRTGRWPARYEHAACLLNFEHTGRSPLPLDEMDALIRRKQMRDAAGFDGYLLLMQAEEFARQGNEGESASRARVAATVLRKCRGPFIVYWPELVARCVKLLEVHEPEFAGQLRQRGARWVGSAACTVGEAHRQRYLSTHPSHAILLNEGTFQV